MPRQCHTSKRFNVLQEFDNYQISIESEPSSS